MPIVVLHKHTRMRRTISLTYALPNPARTWAFAVAATIFGAFTAQGQATKALPLTRYVPGDGLAALLEHEGLDGPAWKATSAYKILNDTSFGAMAGDIIAQAIDRGLQSAPGAPLTGQDAAGILTHMAARGFALGYCGSLAPPQPKAGVFVVRDAGKNEILTRLLGRLEGESAPAGERKGHKVWALKGPPIRWWLEGDDAVFSFAPPNAPDPVAATLDGKSPSAIKNPVVVALSKADGGVSPVGMLFVDLAKLPPLPPKAVQAGLDGIKRVEARWGLQGKAIVAMLGVQAPRPRKGFLALFDQPALGAGTRFAAKGDYSLVSLDPVKTADAILTLLKAGDPGSAEKVTAFARGLQDRTKVDLREEVLGKIGPRVGVVAPGGGGMTNVVAMWFNPPDLGVVAELKDAKGFAATLDRLMAAANVELKRAGSMVPARGPSRPGTEFAEFRRLKAPERGYILAVPPAVLPTPAGLRPTVLIDVARGRIALAGSLASARRVLPALLLNSPEPAEARDAMVFARSDPSDSLPELLVNLPALAQFIGLAASQPKGQPVGPPFRLQLDPDTIPDADAIRQHLFPSKFTVVADAETIRLTTTAAFPLPIPQLNAGMETPMLVALLLPAVQAAREAARRALCVNNEKQIGLAFHNYISTRGFVPPPAILDKAGKPMLSWRVSLLPYLENGDLYNEFHLDEPWDSEHNKSLIARMPAVYACPSRPNTAPGMTAYRVFSGKGTAFDTPGGVKLQKLTDGPSQTIAVVESKQQTPWTSPEELPFDGDGAAALALVGSSHPGGFNVLFLDGSTRFLKITTAAEVFKALLTYGGGEVVGNDY